MPSNTRPGSSAETPEPIRDAAHLHAARRAADRPSVEEDAAAWVEENGQWCEVVLAIEDMNGEELLAMVGPGETEEEFTARMHVALDRLDLQADRLLVQANLLLRLAEEMWEEPPDGL